MKKFVLIICLLLILTGCQNKQPLTKTSLALDTVVTVTLYDGSQEYLDETFNIINDYGNKLDSFTKDSVISSIGTTPTSLDPKIYDLLKENLEFYRLTNGLFNPTLGTLIELWDINEPVVKEPPNQESINQALEHVNPENLVLNDQDKTVLLSDINEKINLGASAKGFIAEQVKEYLIGKNVKNALINLGGNVLAIGNKDGEGYNIGIDNPDNTEQDVLGTIKVSNKSVVTSGNYQRYFTDSQGNIYHHILDPSTGNPAENDLKEVVVISDDSLQADILSTSLFLMGKDEAINFINQNFSNVDIILVTKDNKIYISKGLENNFNLNPELEETYKVIKE